VLPKKVTEVKSFRDFDCKNEKHWGFYFRRIFWQHWGRSLWEQKTKTKTPENLRFCFSPVKNAQKAKYKGPFLFFWLRKRTQHFWRFLIGTHLPDF
jgi:hypothetical protein